MPRELRDGGDAFRAPLRFELEPRVEEPELRCVLFEGEVPDFLDALVDLSWLWREERLGGVAREDVDLPLVRETESRVVCR